MCSTWLTTAQSGILKMFEHEEALAIWMLEFGKGHAAHSGRGGGARVASKVMSIYQVGTSLLEF